MEFVGNSRESTAGLFAKELHTSVLHPVIRVNSSDLRQTQEQRRTKVG